MHQIPHTHNASYANVETAELIWPISDFDFALDEDGASNGKQRLTYFYVDSVSFRLPLIFLYRSPQNCLKKVFLGKRPAKTVF